MERPRQTEDIPYDIDKMAVFLLESELVPESIEHARELTDGLIQEYLDSFGDDIDQVALDKVEDLIAYLREEAVQPVDEEIQLVDEKEAEMTVAEQLDTLIIDLLTEKSLEPVEAQYLMLLFELRQSDNTYNARIRKSLTQQLINLQVKVKTQLRNEPTVLKNKRRAYGDTNLQEGMEILEVLSIILRLPSTKEKPPLTVYLDERVAAPRRQGNEQYYRDHVYEKVYYLLEKALSSADQQTADS